MMPLLLLLACGPSPAPDATQPPSAPLTDALPADSLYTINIPLETATGATVRLDTYRGHPTLISMFYASCPTACPMLVKDIQAIEDKLDPAARANLRVLLVSLDPSNDDAVMLAEAADRYGIDTDRWTLARTAPEHVRTLAALLSVQYRDLPNGEMNHSSILTALDEQGRIQAQMEGLGRDPGPLLNALGGGS